MAKLRDDVVRFEMVLPRTVYENLIVTAKGKGQSRAEFIRRALEKSGIKGVSAMPRSIGRPRKDKNGKSTNGHS